MVQELDIKKLDGMSLDVAETDKERLKAVFPQCFVEGKLDIDKLLSLCGEYIDNDFEKYKFEWKGKSECLRIAGKRSTGTLRPCPEESVDFENTNNLYIEGDNLEVLKLLQTAYYRKVKMIYIDPPYNTGNDFVYEDDFKDPLAKYKEITSQTTKSNPETMGRYHTNWLNMMYPRLRLAANLLRDDGVIFISIDDNEVTNLRKICDEIFGEENFIGEIIWNSTKSVTNTALISVSHTYNLVYAKTKDYYIAHREEFRLKEDGEGFSNPDNDPRGPWKADPFQVGGWRPNQQYDIVNPKTGKVYKPNPACSWKNDYNKFQELMKDNRIVFGTDGTAGPQRKRFLSEATERGKVTKTLWDDIETTTNGTQLLKKLLGGSYFDNPKPVSLIKRMLELSTKDSDIILDFFSGSATTAHAVMQLNAEDGGKRQFIMVQLPEVTDEKSEAFKAGYKNICEIGKERIRRAGKKILEEWKKDHPALTGHPSTGRECPDDKDNSPLWRGGGVADGVVKSRNTKKYQSLPFNAKLVERAKELRKAGNLSEVLLWNQLKNKQFKNLDFDRQKIIGDYIVDFYCANACVVIEIDGISHDSKETYDKIRNNYLENLGLNVIHILDSDIKTNLEAVMKYLYNHPALTGHPSTGGECPDVGFKVLKLDTSNLVKWDDTPLASTDTADLFTRMDGMIESIKKGRSELDVVYEVMLKLGIPATYKVFENNLNGRKVYSIGDDGLILICLDGSNGGITPEDVTAMCELAPAKIVAAEEAFKDDVALSNAFYISKDSGVEIMLL